jgi:hypothetical protein
MINNKERIIWAIATCIFMYGFENQSAKIRHFEMLEKSYNISSNVQKDLFYELEIKNSEIEKRGYIKGFEDGKTHGLISSIHDKGMLDYKQGYHAAINQFNLTENNQTE